jgi:hypothetical protein
VLRPRAPAVAPAPVTARRTAVPSDRPFGLSLNAAQALLCVAGVACCVAMSMPQVHIVAYCGDLGYGAARGAEMLSLMLGFGIVSLFTDLQTTHLLPLFGYTLPFKVARLFYICLGLAWAFHITYTILALRAEQSDLTRNGEFFSVMLIALTNAGQLMLMFISASPHPEMGLAQTFRCWWGVATSLLPWSV